MRVPKTRNVKSADGERRCVVAALCGVSRSVLTALAQMRLFRPVTVMGLAAMAPRRGLASRVWAGPAMVMPAGLATEMGRKKGKMTSTADDGGGGDPRVETVAALKEKQESSLERLKKDFAGISAGKATPDLLAKVMVEAHGTREPLSKVAQVAVKGEREGAIERELC